MNSGILWIKLDQESKIKLLASVSPIYKNVYGDHITLQYNVSQVDYQKFIGQKIEFTVFEICWNDRVQVARVKILSDIACKNKHPHITFSTADMVRPEESNKMLDTNHDTETCTPPLLLNGQIEFYHFKSQN